jgi:hypothetical protein
MVEEAASLFRKKRNEPGSDRGPQTVTVCSVLFPLPTAKRFGAADKAAILLVKVQL